MLSHPGNGVDGVGFPWVATLLARNPALIGVVAMARQLPWVFFSSPAGVRTDRPDHRATSVRANLLMASMTAAVVALALWAHGELRRRADMPLLFNVLSETVWSVLVLYAQDMYLNAAQYGGVSSAWLSARLGPRRGLPLSILGICRAIWALTFTDTPWVAGASLFREAFTRMFWTLVSSV